MTEALEGATLMGNVEAADVDFIEEGCAVRGLSTTGGLRTRRLAAGVAAVWVALFVSTPLLGADPEPIQIKPLAVLAIASFDELRKDGDHLAKLAGQPGLPDVPPLPGDGGKLQVLYEALDGSRPAGGAVYLTADGSFGAIGLIPVRSKDAVLKALDETEFPAEEDEPGVWKMKAWNAYFKVERNYLFIAPAADQLAALPDPAQVLGRLVARYDVAISLGVKNVPGFLRQAFASQVDAGIDAAASQNIGEPGGPANEEEAEEMKKLVKLYMKQLLKMAAEVDRIDYGIAVDRTGGRIFLESVVLAKPGTSVAKSFATVRDFPTLFPSLRDADAPLAMHFTSTHADPEEKKLLEGFGGLMIRKMREGAAEGVKKAVEKIEAEGGPAEVPPELKKLGEESMELFEQVVRDVWEKGRFDAAAVLRLQDGKKPQLYFAVYVPGAKRLEKFLFRAVDLAKEKAAEEAKKAENEEKKPLPVEQRNFARVKGVDLHRYGMPEGLKEKGLDEMRKAFGGDPEFCLGFGDDVVWHGVGVDVVPGLKAAIERSGEKHSLPGGAAVEVGATGFVKLLAAIMEVEKPAEAARLLEAVKGVAPGKDRVRALFEVGPQGEAVYRIEVQDGLIGMGAKLGRLVAEEAAEKAEAERVKAEKALEKVQ